MSKSWPMAALPIALTLLVPAAGRAQPVFNSAAEIASDMAHTAEEAPHGNPWHWATQPRVTLGVNRGPYKATIAWGVVYEAASGNPATNTRVEIRNMRMLALSRRDGQWFVVEGSTKVKGQLFREDFKGNDGINTTIRPEPDGGVSVKPGGGLCFHFWPMAARVPVPDDELAGIVTTFEARLIVDDPAGRDDRAKANFVAAAGGDYWIRTDTFQKPGEDFNPNKSNEIGIGRFKRVTSNWRVYNMTTLPADQLAANPPAPIAPPGAPQ